MQERGFAVEIHSPKTIAKVPGFTTSYGEMVIFYNNRLTTGAYSNAIQNFYTLLLREFRHTG